MKNLEGEITSRIDFVDLVKGICIILVVMSHVGGFFDKIDYHHMLTCFRMPLYFFISGIFFKSYEGFFGFLLRKVNKLLIPFLFFYFSSFILMFLFSRFIPGLFHLPLRIEELLYIFQNHELIRYNPPIWFLIALFNCNILFYIVHLLRQNHLHLMFIVIFVIGVIGFSLGKFGIPLPCYLDVAMTAMPFYVCGFWIRRYNFFLYPHHRFDKSIPLLALVCIIVMYFTATNIGMRTNWYPGNIFQTYIAAFCGIIFIMVVGKSFHSIPFVSYIGRYSVITLGIHGPLFHFLYLFVCMYIHQSEWSSILIFLLLIVICRLVTPVFVKVFPHLVAQKNLIKI